jgi:type IV pilus assembly protein PilM
MASLFLGPKDILGVDIGSYAIKVAHIELGGGSARLRAWGRLQLDVRPESSPEEKKQQCINQLRGFLIQNGIQVPHAATSISGNSVIVRYVKFPRLTKEELRATLPTEAEPFIPFDIKDVQLGFHILGEVVEEGQKKEETVLVAAKKEAVQSRVDILEAAGLKPAIIDVDSFALENVAEALQTSNADVLTNLCLNIGHTVTNLSIIDAGVTRVVRDIFIAGNAFSKGIMKALQCDYAKAEELKKSFGLLLDADEKERALQEGNRDALTISQAISTVLKDMVSEVHRSVDFYLSQGPERSVSRIVLSGGSAYIRNLAKHLTIELKVPVEILNPFAFLKGAEEVPEDVWPSMGVAVGLALRRTGDWD